VSTKPSNPSEEFDFIIVGSGFGGSISAFRLAQKGYRVAVLEKGRRFQKKDFAKTNWNAFRFFWAPVLKCFGIQQITLLQGVMVLHGSGVGGGSLVYANTLMSPRDQVFADKGWPTGVDWQSELKPHYENARKMLGVTTNKLEAEADFLMKEVGKSLGCENTYHPTEVGVFFGKPNEEVRDPYFSGEGPHRTGCTGCGGCMVGCRVGAKNTLDQNYLYFAEKWGAKVFSDLEAVEIKPGQNGYVVTTRRPSRWLTNNGPTFRAKKVILAAGALGTVDLLFRNKEVFKNLPNISNCLGDQVRTNGESLCGATTFEAHRNLSKGIAIGSAIHPDGLTKIEPVRYPEGSDVMRLLAVPLTADGSWWSRPLKLFGQIIAKFPRYLRLLFIRDWAKNSVILLVMQSIDQQLQLKLGRSVLSLFRLSLQRKNSNRLPSYMPIANQAADSMAQLLKGEPQNIFSEVMLGIPATAHILGGCCMGSDSEIGVIDHHHEVFGHQGLYVCDGSVVPVNLGVNPSLTISALAERFAQQFPLSENISEEEFKKRQIRYS
jgi:cholesterol oxidase